jgi:hypothetical protein
MDRTRIEERMNFTRENYRMMRERLLKIIYWQPPEVIRLASRAVRADRKRDVIRPQIDLRPLPRKGGLLCAHLRSRKSLLRPLSTTGAPAAIVQDEPDHDEKDDCAYGGVDDVRHYRCAGANPQPRQEPVADKCAAHPDEHVADDPEALAAHSPRQPS